MPNGAKDGFNGAVDHLATSIDHEVERLGFDHIDILKLSISSMDILRLVDAPHCGLSQHVTTLHIDVD